METTLPTKLEISPSVREAQDDPSILAWIEQSRKTPRRGGATPTDSPMHADGKPSDQFSAINTALERREDIALSAIAEIRDVQHTKKIKHDDA